MIMKFFLLFFMFPEKLLFIICFLKVWRGEHTIGPCNHLADPTIGWL